MNEPVLSLQRLVLELIASRRPSGEILDRVCELVEGIVANGLTSIMRFEEERQALVFAHAPSIPPAVLEAFGALTPGPLAGSCGCAFHSGTMVVVEDTAADPRWQGLREVAKTYGIKACWSVPIRIDDQTLCGTFAISRTVAGGPTEEQRNLLEMAGYLAGIVMRLDKAEGAAKEQSALLQTVVDCSEDAIFVKDKDGRYRLVNAAEARHHGVEPADVIGRTDLEAYAANEMQGATAADRRVLESNASIVHEVEITSAIDGQNRVFLVRRDPIRDGDGTVTGVVGIARDVTDARRFEQAMLQKQKLESLGVLAGGIAHDFNNLLVGVLANASLLGQDDRLPPNLSEAVEDIRTAAERAADLTSQLLQYAGKHEPERQPVELGSLLRELPILLGSALASKAELSFDIPEQLPIVEGDATQLRQVMMNLILNASDSLVDGGGRIDVRVRFVRDVVPAEPMVAMGVPGRGDWLQIEVVDDGVGMDRATQARIFEPFFTTKPQGRGLGLAAVLGIIGSHHGCMGVRSRQGSGTSFTVWLPAADSKVVIPRPERSDEAGQRPDKGRVLIIDDEQCVRNVLRRMLKRSGFEVTEAMRGEQGLEMFASAEPAFDLVVVDKTMPGMDGHEVARALRRQAPALPIVLTSGLGERDAGTGLDPGLVDAFLRKPFTIATVAEQIEQARASAAARATLTH